MKADKEDDEKWSAERMAAIEKARAAIVAHCGVPFFHGPPGSNGVIDCPVCGKTRSLAFSRAARNGHINAACKTQGCVSWME